jgi:hypothetical protein
MYFALHFTRIVNKKIILKNLCFKIFIVHVYAFNSSAYFLALYFCGVCRSQCPRGPSRRSTVARLLRSWVRILPGAWVFVCCVLSGRGLCDELTLVQRSPTDCGASLCVIRKPLGRGGHSPRWAAALEEENNNNNNNNNFCGVGCVTLHGHCKRKQCKKWELLNSSCACLRILKILLRVERNTEILWIKPSVIHLVKTEA